MRYPVLDVHELAAGKLAALFGRVASRDLFDVRELLLHAELIPAGLRLGFVVYGGINRRDWRTISVDEVCADPADVDLQLVPLLRGERAPQRESLVRWTRELVADCQRLLSGVLPLAGNEREFLEQLNGHGEIVAELLTDDVDLQHSIRSLPGLRWKALNVRRHQGLDTEGPD